MVKGKLVMLFEKKVETYIKGDNFSNGLKVKILSHSEDKIAKNRLDYLEEIVNNKTVIHVGCVDHLPLIEEKRKNNVWLHERLVRSSSKCLGIDINEEGLYYLKDKLAYKDVLQMDIITDEIPSQIQKHHWDYMIMGEILEHVDNPVLFLSELRKKFSISVNCLILTVPNAFRYTNFVYGLKNIEFINSDHRFWFTPYTLAKVCAMAGFSVEKYYLCQGFQLPRRKFLTKLLLQKFPLLNDTIVLKAKF
jgi:hypothetical protein